jgi:hypothetical protein
MESRHPIDRELRIRLRELSNQAEFARQIGSKQSWLHKFINGSGHATVDDAIRIVAALMGVKSAALSEPEQKLLKIFRGLGEDQQDDVVQWLSTVRKRGHRGSPGSAAPVAQTPPATARKARDTPRAG